MKHSQNLMKTRLYGALSAVVLVGYFVATYGPVQLADAQHQPPFTGGEFIYSILRWSLLPSLLGIFWLFWPRVSRINQILLIGLVIINIFIIIASYLALMVLNANDGAFSQTMLHAGLLVLMWIVLPAYVWFSNRKIAR